MLKKVLKKIFLSIFYYLDKMIKKENIIIFTCFSEITDNCYAMYKYLKKNNYNYRYIWIVSSKKENKNLKTDKNLEIYKSKSFKGVYYYLKSKYVFGSHGTYTNFPKNKNRIRINLWHGMPLKAIGLLYKGKEKREKSKDNLAISTSNYFQNIMSQAFGIDIDKVLVAGQPRNDLLFEKTEYFQKMNIDKKQYLKIFIWAPTFRKSREYQNVDWAKSGIYNEEYISILPIEKLCEINKILKEKKYLLIIKLHPFDKLQDIKFRNFSNIIILKSEDLENINEQLYPLLGATDALITDYSSIWIDYDILEKPIFFAMNDYKEYKNSRGLLFEDFIDISPYPIIKDYEEFITFLKKYERIDLNKRKITDKYNKYKDNKSCERIIKYLGIDKNEN